MDFTLSEDQAAFQKVARDFARDRMLPHAATWDREKTFPVDTLREAAALGFGGIYVRDDVGGSALSRFDAALIMEELAAACPSTAAYLSIHNLAAWMIAPFAADAQRRRLLPKLCSMEHFASYCLTEPGAGSTPPACGRRPCSTAITTLNGSKAFFIPGGGRSDIYVTMVRTGGEGAGGVSCLAIENGTSGLSFGKQEDKLGWNSQPTAAVIFENCRVPVANRIGPEGHGFRIAMAGLDGGRINIGACSLGGARACLETASRYVVERKQFGKPIADFQATQFKLADMATELEAARLLIHKAASLLDARSPEATQASAMAKRFATDAGFRIVNEALQLHGGYGYLKDFPLERYLRDLRVHQILEGTNEIMRVVIARRLMTG